MNTYLLIGDVQATGYGRATFHPTVGLYPTYIISAEILPLSWVMYPLRRNYSSSFITIRKNTHANTLHSWVCRASREVGKEIDKLVSSTTELQASQFGFRHPWHPQYLPHPTQGRSPSLLHSPSRIPSLSVIEGRHTKFQLSKPI